ncbi:MAG: hypothetical protein KBD78_07005 [Oligoflexales bacterium]|nr:hypothetical protein [Oligoflexales bacterium]
MRLFNFSILLIASAFVFSCNTEQHSSPLSVDGTSVEKLTFGMGKETKTVEGLFRLNHNVGELLSKLYPKDEYINIQSDSCFAIPARVTFTATWEDVPDAAYPPISDYTIDQVVFTSSYLQFISDCSGLSLHYLPAELIRLPYEFESIVVRNNFLIKTPKEVVKSLPGEDENIVIEYHPIASEWEMDDVFALSMYGLDALKLFFVSEGNAEVELGSIGDIYSGLNEIQFNYICGLSSDSEFKAAALLTDDKCNIKNETVPSSLGNAEYINIIDIEPLTK